MSNLLQVLEEHFQDAEHIFTGSFSLLQGTWLSCLLLAVETEMSKVQRLKSTEVHKNPQSLPKRLIWIGTDTQISLGKHFLGQNNDTAATCDICLLEQQGFPPHSTLGTNLANSTLWSCCSLLSTLNTGGQHRNWIQQLQLHRNPSSSSPGKTCSKTSLTCSERHLD